MTGARRADGPGPLGAADGGRADASPDPPGRPMRASGAADRKDSLPIYLTAGLLVLVVCAWQFRLLAIRGFDLDELEHLHAGWAMARGLVPYRDYFEHHTPWLYFLLAGLVMGFDVDGSGDDAVAFILLARRWMWVLTGAILVTTFALGRLWRGPRAAAVGVLLLAQTVLFLQKALEIRPDVPAALFWLASLLLLLSGVRAEGPRHRRAWRFALSGACFGAGLMCTQKLLLALLGLGPTMLWYLLDRRGPDELTGRARDVALALGGLAVPLLATLGWFAAHGALGPFLHFNLVLNLGWRRTIAPGDFLWRLVGQNPLLVALALGGLARSVAGIARAEVLRRGDYVLVLNTLGLLAGVFIIPVPYPQYFLTFLPLLALLGGTFLLDVVDAAVEVMRRRRAWRWASDTEWAVAAVLAAVALGYALRVAQPPVLAPVLSMALWAGVLVLAVPLLLGRARQLALALVLAAASVHPLLRLAQTSPGWTNSARLGAIRYVLAQTTPQDTVMDGWTGVGVFRPHAYPYFFLHREIQATLTDAQRRALLADLRAGRIAPTLIFYDRFLRALSSDFRAFFEERYAPVGYGPIWRRKAAKVDFLDRPRPTVNNDGAVACRPEGRLT